MASSPAVGVVPVKLREFPKIPPALGVFFFGRQGGKFYGQFPGALVDNACWWYL
jgi:hypothetical protein